VRVFGVSRPFRWIEVNGKTYGQRRITIIQDGKRYEKVKPFER